MSGRNVSLTPRLNRFVDGQVETGRHQNASEVIREALRRYEEEIDAERQLLDVLGSMIDRSDANIAAGRFVEASTDEELEALIAGIGERASARLKAKQSA
jgi:antitoxin ParD1/3/4